MPIFCWGFLLTLFIMCLTCIGYCVRMLRKGWQVLVLVPPLAHCSHERHYPSTITLILLLLVITSESFSAQIWIPILGKDYMVGIAVKSGNEEWELEWSWKSGNRELNKFKRGKRDRTLSMIKCWLGMAVAGIKSRMTSSLHNWMDVTPFIEAYKEEDHL